MQILWSGKFLPLACFAVFSIVNVSISAQVTTPASPSARPWMNKNLSPDERAELVLKQMTLEEKINLLHGTGMAHVPNWQTPLTYLSNGGAGMTLGVPRLGIPNIYMSDAAYGVRSSGENGRYSTALPSPVGAASSWSTEAACEYGGLIGRELRAQGYNMTLGGGVNLTREPRNGRTFEYMGEDPLLAGTLVGHRIKCEQAEHVIGDIKHYALNDQETGRNIVDVHMSKRAMQESDLLAFQIGIRIGNPGAVMCSYNRIDGDYACENKYLLTDVLKEEWNYKGFVVSDWGGTHSTQKASAAGLDNEQPMDQYFGPQLKEAVESGRVPMTEIDDHAHRILRSEFLSGIVDDPIQKSVVDVERGFEISQRIEEQSIVLLKNEKNILPLDQTGVHNVAIIGAHADVGMISGGGSAQVDPPGGNAIMPPGQGATHWQDHIWFPTSPLKALKEKLPGANFTFNTGDNATSAADLARKSDIAIVFASQWTSEGMDLPNLSLPNHQDGLIEQVAAANPRTIVVLETGTAVTMPWLNKVAAVVEAWYAGSRGHIALANVLTGTVNPSGKLAMTFPKSEQDLPRPVIAPLSKEDEGSGSSAVNGTARSTSNYSVHYDEGVKVGYKWYEAEHKQPLFPFGFGLSYTSYSYSGLTTDSTQKTVSFTVKNTGKRTGAEIAQIYAVLPQQAGEPFKRLVGWQRVDLSPGESKTISVTVDPQMLSIFDEQKNDWQLPPGRYRILAGPSSATTPLTGFFDLK
ncbi:beta-glucosidase [Edaphobacter albus]|uniref:beta-glucosidase n=1 Tax=Edaphobacter sp. 4G125 TaxID=2763071 RepID=UPI0016484A84|nr:glycoside hydrolase family 3 C-terminal domain-containing protein [Edaphobacter sp. 4G125]QNI35619.1 glycoside hydrolase family 3 C-terminal domain-containing protein [Edaphobacter sp. 4G125]